MRRAMPQNSYFTFTFEGTTPWDPYDRDDLPVPGAAYFGGLFRELERHWDGDPLTFYLTHHTTELPSYGPDVVVVLLNDEWYRTPAYSGNVLAILRNLPLRPWFSWDTLVPPTTASAFAAANHLRVLAEGRRADRNAARVRAAQRWPRQRRDNAIDIPLGYYHQPEMPIKPFAERGTDVFFAGSLLHDMERKRGWKRTAKLVVGNPKQVYRKRMIEELDSFRARHPELTAKVTVTGDFRDLAGDQVTSYADDMMDARIALVPRGTAAESYRLFEAWRYGCIVICEALPPRYFLQGAPAITLRSWSELEQAMGDLLADPGRQRALHEASLTWWQEVCSEQAVGRRLAAQLGALRLR